MTRLLAILSLTILITAPALAAPPAKGDLVPGQYLVVLKKTGTFGGLLSADQIATLAKELAGQYGGTLLLTYGNALNGYLVKLDDRQAAALGKDPLVKYVEQDSFVAPVRMQTKAPWGLDRIDQRKPGITAIRSRPARVFMSMSSTRACAAPTTSSRVAMPAA